MKLMELMELMKKVEMASATHSADQKSEICFVPYGCDIGCPKNQDGFC